MATKVTFLSLRSVSEATTGVVLLLFAADILLRTYTYRWLFFKSFWNW